MSRISLPSLAASLSALCLAGAATALTGCGQKGPLNLPKATAASAASAAAASAAAP